MGWKNRVGPVTKVCFVFVFCLKTKLLDVTSTEWDRSHLGKTDAYTYSVELCASDRDTLKWSINISWWGGNKKRAADDSHMGAYVCVTAWIHILSHTHTYTHTHKTPTQLEETCNNWMLVQKFFVSFFSSFSFYSLQAFVLVICQWKGEREREKERDGGQRWRE